MKTRYTSLVSVKKNIMQKSERVLQNAHANLNTSQAALKISLQALQEITSPQTGQISDYLSARSLIDSQREVIKNNEEWVAFVQKEIIQAQEQLKFNMIEYEKFNYLELEEIKQRIKKQKFEEAKELDEIALITYGKNRFTKEVS